MSTQLSSSTQKPRTNLDPLFRLITRCFAFLVLALLAAILLSLIQGATPAIKHFGLGFLTNASWDPVAQDGLFTGDFTDTDKGRTMTETLLDAG